MLVLAGLGRLEHGLLRLRRTMSVTVRTNPDVTEEWMRERLAAEGLTIVSSRVFDHRTDRVFEMRLKGPARQFDIVRTELADHAASGMCSSIDRRAG